MKHYMTPADHNEAVEYLVSLQSTISKLLDPKYMEVFEIEAKKSKMIAEIRNDMIDLLARFPCIEIDDIDAEEEAARLIDRLGGFA